MEEELLNEMYPKRKSIMATYARIEVTKVMSEFSKRQKLLMLKGMLEVATVKETIDLLNTEINYINGKNI